MLRSLRRRAVPHRAHRLPLLFVSVGALTCLGCEVENYDDPNGPRWSGEYRTENVPLGDEVSVVTFNIEFSIKIDEAIRDLKAHDTLSRAQIVLLQEMDETGTDRIAKALGYDYVYYPSSRHEDDRNYGEAILSKWPIVRDQKLILPHRDPMNGRLRIAVLAVLDTPRGPLGVASVHTDVPWLGPEGRLDQARAVRDAALALDMPLIVGGDFNTSDFGSVDATVDVFEEKGFAYASKGVENSGSAFGKHTLDLDHVFSMGLPRIAAGMEESDASDHFPVWVKLDASGLPEASDTSGAGGAGP